MEEKLEQVSRLKTSLETNVDEKNLIEDELKNFRAGFSEDYMRAHYYRTGGVGGYDEESPKPDDNVLKIYDVLSAIDEIKKKYCNNEYTINNFGKRARGGGARSYKKRGRKQYTKKNKR